MTHFSGYMGSISIRLIIRICMTLQEILFMGSDILQEVPMYKNNEGYPDPTAGRAIWKADKPPEEVINFRRAMKLMSVICHVRILGKVTVVDDKGRRW
jgi:hypothetical protein